MYYIDLNNEYIRNSAWVQFHTVNAKKKEELITYKKK